MLRLSAFALLACLCATAQTVEGTVVESTSGNGLAGARVEIAPAAAGLVGEAAYTAVTDALGRFRIDNVKDGVYVARYTASGYLYEAALAPGRPFQVVARGNAVALEGRMIKMAEASGRVLDGRGDPVPSADMEATQIGRGTMGFRSDAEGKFRIPVIPNENYTLMVHPPSQWKPPDPEPGTDRPLGWAPTYYPGVTVPGAAGKILLPPGGRMENIELKIRALPAHSVHGTLGGPDGKPASKVPVVMGEDLLRPIFRQETGPDGTFDFSAVIDGHWLLASEADSPSGKLRVVEWFEVSGRDVKDLKPRLSAPFTAHGRIAIEKVEGRETPKPPTISLQPLVRWVYPNVFGTPDSDGDFGVERVYPGPYQFHAPEPPGYYLDAVRIGGVDISGPAIDMAAGAPLLFVFKANGGSVRGSSEKCEQGTVALIPRDEAKRWRGFLRTAQCDSADRYNIGAVRPGEYYVVAFAADEIASLRINQLTMDGNIAPLVPEGLLSQAPVVMVKAGETATADVRRWLR
jgi:Carboxypeptidase regulatory-like domain